LGGLSWLLRLLGIPTAPAPAARSALRHVGSPARLTALPLSRALAATLAKPSAAGPIPALAPAPSTGIADTWQRLAYLRGALQARHLHGPVAAHRLETHSDLPVQS